MCYRIDGNLLVFALYTSFLSMFLVQMFGVSMLTFFEGDINAFLLYHMFQEMSRVRFCKLHILRCSKGFRLKTTSLERCWPTLCTYKVCAEEFIVT